jgi:hypothetical protein
MEFTAFMALVLGSMPDPILLILAALGGIWSKRWKWAFAAGAGAGLITYVVVASMRDTPIPTEIFLAKIAAGIFLALIAFSIAKAFRTKKSEETEQ